jgi:hypothetical protein
MSESLILQEFICYYGAGNQPRAVVDVIPSSRVNTRGEVPR